LMALFCIAWVFQIHHLRFNFLWPQPPQITPCRSSFPLEFNCLYYRGRKLFSVFEYSNTTVQRVSRVLYAYSHVLCSWDLGLSMLFRRTIRKCLH
jgi:hypothetical protein